MTTEHQVERIIYLYKVTCITNNKIYIGQSVDPTGRWRAHRRDSSDPKVQFHYAIKKYGSHNFEFEVIACCKTQDDANDMETELVAQYNSFVSSGYGYNATHGGMNAPKSEAWIQAMKNWHASLSPEEKAARSKMHSESMLNIIATKGHPAQGTKRTPDQVQNLIQARKDHPVVYTDEIRERMSLAHLGKELPAEQIEKMAVAIKENWDKRLAELESTGNIKCHAEGCTVYGTKIKYIILNEIRYCSTHGQRLRNTGSLQLNTNRSSHNKGVPMSEEAKEKVRLAKLGKVPPGQIKFTKEQVESILNDSRPSRLIANDFNVSQNTILRLKNRKNDFLISIILHIVE